MSGTSANPHLLAIVLAAGQGTRMKSTLPKVLHAIGGRPMLLHVLEAARAAGAGRLAVVVSPATPETGAAAQKFAAETGIFVQDRQLGTAHAVLAAAPAFAGFGGDVLVLYGDTPLILPETLMRLRKALADGAALAVLGFHAADPHGYGRLILDASGHLQAIREERDASEDERAITLCNSGVMAFRAPVLAALLPRIGNENAKGEYYLTDAVALARTEGLPVAVAVAPEAEVQGVNDRAQLAMAEAVLQGRMRARAMAGGVTLIAPETVTFAHDTILGQDCLIEPHVFFGPGVTVGNGVHIRAFCHIEGARIEDGATIGPFARLRPGTHAGPDVRIGNFVEIKNASIEAEAKINHLTYVGDARVGAKANVGAGVITCNYDGHNKHHTDIGAGAFIGSNSALVAPVRIGDGAYVGSGSVITGDVAPDALALARARQTEIPDWAARMRARYAKPDGKP
jgi:bifunctional UDP-N-acetylglucosamine pyrophosphorylase/glucosamine-1-phosphate N-acetyltransferase